jgi:hypothetical protein
MVKAGPDNAHLKSGLLSHFWTRKLLKTLVDLRHSIGRNIYGSQSHFKKGVLKKIVIYTGINSYLLSERTLHSCAAAGTLENVCL